MDSNISRVKIYVRLLGEGTEVCRPTEALDLGNGLFEVLPTAHYDTVNERWEFPPRSVVRGKRIEAAQDTYLLAVSREDE